MYEIVFSVAGKPIGQGSMRHVGGGRLIHSSKLNEWRQQVVQAVVDQAALTGMLTGAIRVRYEFTIPYLKNYRPGDLPTTRSSYDGDKLERAIADALTIGRLIEDDSRIVGASWDKRYGEYPGVLIKIGRIND